MCIYHKHLTKSMHRVVGIITRKDIARAFKEPKDLDLRFTSEYSIGSFREHDLDKLQRLYSLP
jgi:hypothetical protein